MATRTARTDTTGTLISLYDMLKSATGTANTSVYWSRAVARHPELAGLVTSLRPTGETRQTPMVTEAGWEQVSTVLGLVLTNVTEAKTEAVVPVYRNTDADTDAGEVAALRAEVARLAMVVGNLTKLVMAGASTGVSPARMAKAGSYLTADVVPPVEEEVAVTPVTQPVTDVKTPSAQEDLDNEVFDDEEEERDWHADDYDDVDDDD